MAHSIIMSLLTLGGIANYLRPFGMEFFFILNEPSKFELDT